MAVKLDQVRKQRSKVNIAKDKRVLNAFDRPDQDIKVLGDDISSPSPTLPISPEVKPPKRNVSVTKEYSKRNNDLSVTNAQHKSNVSVSNEEPKRNNTTSKRIESVTEAYPKRNNKSNVSVTSKAQHKRNVSVTKIGVLRSNEKVVFEYIVHLCDNSSDRITTPITYVEMCECLDEIKTRGIARTTTNRLIDKGLVEKISSQVGNGAFLQFTIPPEVFNEVKFKRNVSVTYEYPKRNRSVTESVTESVTTDSSSSRLDNNKQITTTIRSYEDLPDEWLSIDFTGLEKYNFTKTHILQAYQSDKMSFDRVQDSINAFANDLRFDDVRLQIKSPLGLIMKCLRNGEDYCPVKEYKDDFTVMLARKKEIELQKKRDREALEKEYYDLCYENWVASLSSRDITSITNMQPKQGEFGSGAKRLLASYYDREIWPVKRLERI